MRFSQFVAGEKYYTQRAQKKEKTGSAKEKNDKAELSIGTLRGKRSVLDKKKVMKGKITCSSHGFGGNISSLSVCKLDDMVPNTPPMAYLSLLQFVTVVDRE